MMVWSVLDFLPRALPPLAVMLCRSSVDNGISSTSDVGLEAMPEFSVGRGYVIDGSMCDTVFRVTNPTSCCCCCCAAVFDPGVVVGADVPPVSILPVGRDAMQDCSVGSGSALDVAVVIPVVHAIPDTSDGIVDTFDASVYTPVARAMSLVGALLQAMSRRLLPFLTIRAYLPLYTTLRCHWHFGSRQTPGVTVYTVPVPEAAVKTPTPCVVSGPVAAEDTPPEVIVLTVPEPMLLSMPVVANGVAVAPGSCVDIEINIGDKI